MAISAAPNLAMFDVSRQRLTAHQFVHDTLRRAILSGALRGGTRLVQADLAAQLAVSTTPVREALRDLTVEGLVEFHPHLGAVVRAPNLDEVVEMYEIRQALEPLAIRRAAERITPEELAEADSLLKAMDAERDPAAWAELNTQFHQIFERAADAPFLQSIIKSVQDVAEIYVAHSLELSPNRLTAGNREHRAILHALRRKDVEAAQSLQIKHIDSTLQSIVKYRPENGHG